MTDNSNVNYGYYAPPKKKNSKVGLIIGIVAAVIIIAALAVIFVHKLFKDDKTRVFKGLSAVAADMMEKDASSVFSVIRLGNISEKNASSSVSLDLELEEVPYSLVEDAMISVEGFSLEVNANVDAKNKEYDGNVIVGYLDQELVSLGIYGSETEMKASLPQLFEGYVRIPAEDVVSAYNNSVFGEYEPLDESMDISLNLFKEAEENKALTELGAALTEDAKALYDSVIVEKGEETRTFTIGGESKKAKHYSVTLPQKMYYPMLDAVLEFMLDEIDEFLAAEASSADINDAKRILKQMFSEDIVFDVYMIKDSVVAIELETELEAQETTVECFAEIILNDLENYNQSFEGEISVKNDYGDGYEAEFVKITETSDSYSESKWSIVLDDLYDIIDIDIVSSYDSKDGEYSYEVFVDDGYEPFEFGMNGYLNDYKEGTSYDLNFDEVYLTAEGETLALSGGIAFGPMDGSVENLEGMEYDVLNMSEDELYDWIYEIEENVYNLLYSFY